MDTPMLRLLIHRKIDEGSLPHDRMPRVWDGPGNGETCDGCGDAVTKAQTIMEGVAASGFRAQFHVACFHVWEVERQFMARAQKIRHGRAPLYQPNDTTHTGVRFPRQS